MADEINPITGKPYSTNPRAQSARRKRNRRKSNAANQAENERVLQRQREEWEDLQEQKENKAIDVEDLKQQEDMKQGNYLESKKMDEIYAKDKAANSEFDRLVEEARGLTGRAKAAKLKQAGRIREGNTGISISEVPGAAWGVAESYAQSMMEDPAAISEHFTDMWLDTKAFGAGAAKGAMAGALVDGPLPFGETAGALIGGTAAVATRRFGKKALKEFFDWSLDSGRRLIYGDEVVDAATGMPMRIDNADDFTSAKPLMSRNVNPPDGSINLDSSGKPIRNTGGNPYLTYGERKGLVPLPSEDEVIRRQKLGRDWQDLDGTLGRKQTRAKTGKWLNTPDKVRRDILLEKKKLPTLEELDQAVVRGGNEVPGWTYNRSSVEGFSNDLAKQLQKELGGTNAQRDAFQTLQKKTKSNLQKDIKALNKRMQFDYLEFANTAVQEGERLGRKLTDEDIYEIFTTMAKNPKNADMFDLGHNISAKNVARQKRKGKLTTADYASNMDIEIKKSIKDLIFRESKSGEIIPAPRQAMETSTSAKNSNVLRIVEKGNIARGSRTDAPKVVQLLKGVSPNIETEYLRFLDPQFDKILTDIIPHENHDEFMQFLRDGIKKWQGRGDDRLIGKQQLDLFPQKIRELIDDYLNLQDAKPYQVLKEDIDTIKRLKIKNK